MSFSSEVEASSLSLPIVNRSVGVDLGLTHLATLSTGEKIPNPRRLKAHLRYLRQQQRCLARRQKGSKRRERGSACGSRRSMPGSARSAWQPFTG